VWGKKKVLVTGLVILVIIIVGLVVGNVILMANQENQVDSDRQDEESEYIEDTEDYEIVVELHGAEGSSSTSASGSGE